MGVAAITGYENVNGRALDLWEKVYPGVLLVALTDTFSTEAFYQV
jgi:nicotinate phosphoribosyltransferase